MRGKLGRRPDAELAGYTEDSCTWVAAKMGRPHNESKREGNGGEGGVMKVQDQ